MRIDHGVADRIKFALARLRKRVGALLALLEGGGFRRFFILLIDNEGHVSTYQLTYGEGEKYPVLERDGARPDLLSKIIAPLTGTR